MRHDRHAVSFPVHVKRLPQNGLPLVIEADAEQRARLAADHDLVSVERFRAELLVSAWKRNGVKVEGRVEAAITQACVVTLDPLQSLMDEEVSGLFLPDDSKLGREGFHQPGEIHLDPDGPDSPETFSGDTIDVGALAEEFFALAIDPYPRKPDAALPAPEAPGVDGPLQQKLRALRSEPES